MSFNPHNTQPDKKSTAAGTNHLAKANSSTGSAASGTMLSKKTIDLMTRGQLRSLAQ